MKTHTVGEASQKNEDLQELEYAVRCILFRDTHHMDHPFLEDIESFAAMTMRSSIDSMLFLSNIKKTQTKMLLIMRMTWSWLLTGEEKVGFLLQFNLNNRSRTEFLSASAESAPSPGSKQVYSSTGISGI